MAWFRGLREHLQRPQQPIRDVRHLRPRPAPGGVARRTLPDAGTADQRPRGAALHVLSLASSIALLGTRALSSPVLNMSAAYGDRTDRSNRGTASGPAKWN